MQWFSNLRIGTKLYLSFGIILLILIVIISISFFSIKHIEKTTKITLNEKIIFLEKLVKIRDSQSDSQQIFFNILVKKNKSELSNEFEKLSLLYESRLSLLNELKNLQKNDPNLLLKISNLEKIDQELKITREEKIVPLIQQNKMPEASKIILNSQIVKLDELGNYIIDLINEIRNQIDNTLISMEQNIQNTIFIIGILGILSIIIVFGLVSILIRQIVNPLKEITTAATDISVGKIDNEKLSGYGRKDEVGVLAKAFYEMSSWLTQISKIAISIAGGDLTSEVKLRSKEDVLGNSVKTMLHNLRKLTHETASGIQSLETSASEISAATAQLSASASETATAISETTTTIEEVKQTSHLANQKAKYISESTQKANETATDGKKAAENIHETMNHIQQQMNLISESMLRLSEQNQAIGSIITTVEEMAQQSNLLSVNASIEAAKAGDHGRGFAIVAQEVKMLASQSRQATNQVREILSDIQKATSQAVMATEQGSKSVEAAVHKSQETGKAILGLVASVSSSSKDALQIAATTNQQLVGMEQAATAMENIKQATYQNVEGSKQLELAAKIIKELGGDLRSLISRYKLNKDDEKS